MRRYRKAAAALAVMRCCFKIGKRGKNNVKQAFSRDRSSDEGRCEQSYRSELARLKGNITGQNIVKNYIFNKIVAVIFLIVVLLYTRERYGDYTRVFCSRLVRGADGS